MGGRSTPSATLSTAVPILTLDSAAGPLEIDLGEGTIVTECQGPPGASGDAAADLVARAVAAPGHGPPLAAHVVPGDRVTIALAGGVPQTDAVVRALAEAVVKGGVTAADVGVLEAPPLEADQPAATAAGRAVFDPDSAAATSYLAADAAARPLYFSRTLVDADVVVSVGGFRWDAALGGRSPVGEIWPAFGRRENRAELVLDLVGRGRDALVDWRGALHDITWQLGVCASLRLVAGRRGSLHAASFGLPEEAAGLARKAAEAWRPRVEEPAETAIATLSPEASRFADVIRAVAAAARVTLPDATVVVVAGELVPPGIVVTRWRQGAPLGPLVREATESGDPALVADALLARQLARTLGDRRLVLLSGIDEAAVEDLGFAHAAGAADLERLANRADRLVVLHEADLMLPRR